MRWRNTDGTAELSGASSKTLMDTFWPSTVEDMQAIFYSEIPLVMH